MTEQERLSKEERDARDAVRALPVEGMESSFRKDLGDLFVSGEVERVLSDSGSIDPDGVASPPIEGEADTLPVASPAASARPRVVAPPAWARPLAWTLAAAASLWLVLSFWSSDPGPGWQVAAAVGAGTVWLDDVPHAAGDLVDIRLGPGTRVRTDESVGLELIHPGLYALSLSSDCDFSLPQAEDDRVFVAAVRKGVATWVTGPSFPGHELRIEAPDADVLVHGTTFAVLADDEKTCVSVYEGEVGVSTPDGRLQPVGPGRCRRVFRAPDAGEAETELSPGQVAGLTHWSERSRDLFAAAH